MSSVNAAPNVLARKGTFVMLLAVLLLAACAFGQPQVDSVFVFDENEGYFTTSVLLPGGDYVLAGYTYDEGFRTYFRVARMTPEREILWTRDLLAVGSFRKEVIVLDGEFVVGIARAQLPSDTGSLTIDDIAFKYTLDGDSIWARKFSDSNFAAFLNSIIPDGSGGYFVLGNVTVSVGPSFNQQVNLSRTDAAGTVLWEQNYGGPNHDQAGDIVKLEGDSLLIATVMNIGTSYNVVFLWTNLSGDSLTSRTYGDMGVSSFMRPASLHARDGGWEFVWREALNSGPSLNLLHWLRTEYDGTLIRELSIDVPENSVQGFQQSEDGLRTVGYTPFGTPIRNAVLGRLNALGQWYYQDTLASDVIEAYGFLPTSDGTIAVLGRTQVSDTILNACIFYVNDGGHAGYLFSSPAEVDFGVVPVDDVAVQSVSFFVTWDSAATITDIELPEFIATTLTPPVQVMPGDSSIFQFGFRPTELVRYSDAIVIHASARNSVLTIPVFGQAPFPECTPALRDIYFTWAEIGDSIRRPFAVFNTGTLPLHIDEIVQPAPFYLDNTGPFVIEPDTNALLWITFRPDSVVLYEVNLVLQSDDPQGADTVLLRGRGLVSQEADDDLVQLPHEFKLLAAFPNPFNATAVIRFELPKTQLVKLELFDITGRLVKEVAWQNFSAGEHQIVIDGAGLASGIYFAAIKAGENYAVQKLLLVR
ncbi:MAG: T9SS type A sorting domain-containing protein [bacterium]|nr:T9SS type A sorting domain-containing protein [bacterium]